jgi:hypothetical protein
VYDELLQINYPKVIPQDAIHRYAIRPVRKGPEYTGSSTHDQLPFRLVGRKSAIYLLTAFCKLSNLFIMFVQFISLIHSHATDA